MPTYKITDPKTGRTVRVTGDSPPTESELEGIFGAVHGESPSAAAPPSPAQGGDLLLDNIRNVGNVALGAAKGIGTTVTGLGQLAYDYVPGVKQASDAMQRAAFGDVNDQMMAGAQKGLLAPTNTAQTIGKTAEQVGEFFIPVADAGALAKVPGLTASPQLARRGIAAAQAAGQTAAQGGGPAAAVVSGVMAGALPGSSSLQAASGALERSAVQTMADSLRATKEWAKAESADLAPEMLKRGIGGTFNQMRTLARETAAKVGQNLGDAYKAAAAAGETVQGQIVQGNIQLASDALHVPDASGKLIAIPGHEEAIAKLDKLATFVEQLGPDIPVDKAAIVKQAWDDIVSKAGLYGNKATASASEKAQAWSFRSAANAFRDKLNTNPDIADLNKEFSFWAGLRDVVNATKLRKTGQTGGLFRAGATATGAGVGALSGESPSERAKNAVIYGVAGSQLTKLMQSPWWMSKASAPFKQMLSDALASGKTEVVMAAVKRALTAAPAQVGAEF